MATSISFLLLLTYAFVLAFTFDAVSAKSLNAFSQTRDTSHDLRRSGVTVNNNGGDVVVFNSKTDQLILQGVASDGAGSGYDTAAILWIMFTFVVGVPLAGVGIRGWRMTLGATIGLSTAVSAWAAFINTEASVGVPDPALIGIVIGFFVIGFIIGLFEFGRIAGTALLGIVGGMALGIRVVLFRKNLLVGLLFINWIIIAACGIAGLVLILVKQRIGVAMNSASSGTFLVGLGVDLSINKQQGLSRGLRLLFDRNVTHLADILSNGYSPKLSTFIILGGSLAFIPLLAFVQHWLFRDPFNRNPPDEGTLDFDPAAVETIALKNKETQNKYLNASRFSA